MKQILKFHLSGVCPLLMHNGQLADPLNAWAKAIKQISGKRIKTEADQEEMARLEWFGSLYLDNGKPCIPGYCMDATLINAAKKTKKGMQAKFALVCDGNFPLEYEGTDNTSTLWEDARFRRRALMRIKGAGIMRTQPLFFPWGATIVVSFNDAALNPKDIETFVHTAGESVGLLEGRPRFGRFVAQRL